MRQLRRQELNCLEDWRGLIVWVQRFESALGKTDLRQETSRQMIRRAYARLAELKCRQRSTPYRLPNIIRPHSNGSMLSRSLSSSTRTSRES